MNIILVSNNLAKIKTITITRSQLIAAMGMSVAILLLILYFAYAQVSPSGSKLQSFARHAFGVLPQASGEQEQRYLRDSMHAMALRLGEMQAQLLRLDTVGERLARSIGLKTSEFKFEQVPARGGLAPTSYVHEPSMFDMQAQMEELDRLLRDRTDKLDVIDSVLMDERLRRKKLPTMKPVVHGWRSSNYGMRIDPFTGGHAFHEGIDFIAEAGTPVSVAASGVVSRSELQGEYGNMIEVDHGNGLSTRYAHLSRRLVTVGDVVFKGQKIAEVGNTGRSTGPHLHFEVRDGGQSVNPAKFLDADG